MADHFPMAGESEAKYTHDGCFIADKNCNRGIQLDNAIPNKALQATNDTISIVFSSDGDDIAEAAEAEVTELGRIVVVPINAEPSQTDEVDITELGSIVVVPINSEPSEDGNGSDSETSIGQEGGNAATNEKAMQLIARAIYTVGLLTVTAVGRMVLLKPASGVVFGHNKLAYYVTLAVIFSLGVVELFIGTWISMSDLTYLRRLWIGGLVLFLSIWPFLGIISMGGLA